MKPSMTLGQAAAEVIEEKLHDRDWTVAVLARRAGMDRVTLWRKISSRSRFDLDTFDAVAHAFGISPRTLMGEVLARQSAALADPNSPEAIASSMESRAARDAATRAIAESEERRKRDEGPDERPKEA